MQPVQLGSYPMHFRWHSEFQLHSLSLFITTVKILLFTAILFATQRSNAAQGREVCYEHLFRTTLAGHRLYSRSQVRPSALLNDSHSSAVRRPWYGCGQGIYINLPELLERVSVGKRGRRRATYRSE